MVKTPSGSYPIGSMGAWRATTSRFALKQLLSWSQSYTRSTVARNTIDVWVKDAVLSPASSTILGIYRVLTGGNEWPVIVIRVHANGKPEIFLYVTVTVDPKDKHIGHKNGRLPGPPDAATFIDFTGPGLVRVGANDV